VESPRAGLIERDCNTCANHRQGEGCAVQAACLLAPPVGQKLPLWQPLQLLLPRPRPQLVST
jgi:hypothetical protein